MVMNVDLYIAIKEKTQPQGAIIITFFTRPVHDFSRFLPLHDTKSTKVKDVC
jgi:hypothetical protein